jgi:hypothetical protein
MRDYRLPKSHRHQRGHRPLLAKKSRPASRQRTAAPSSGISSFLGKILSLVIGIGILAGVAYGLFRGVLPKLIPLNQSKNIVIVSSYKEKPVNQIMVAHFKPQDGLITAVMIPADQSVKVAGGFGEYPLRSVWNLLEMEKKDDTFIRSAFSFAVGEVIDGVVVTSEPKLPSSQFELETLLRQAVQHQTVNGLGVRDQLALYFAATKLPAEKVKIRPVDSWSGWERYRSDLGLQFSDQDCPVAVVNTTAQSGLAASVSQVIEQSGYTVVRVTDNPEAEPHSRVVFASDSEVCAAKAASLAHLFPQKVSVEADTALTQTYRAKIILELGEDIQSVIPVK